MKNKPSRTLLQKITYEYSDLPWRAMAVFSALVFGISLLIYGANVYFYWLMDLESLGDSSLAPYQYYRDYTMFSDLNPELISDDEVTPFDPELVKQLQAEGTMATLEEYRSLIGEFRYDDSGHKEAIVTSFLYVLLITAILAVWVKYRRDIRSFYYVSLAGFLTMAVCLAGFIISVALSTTGLEGLYFYPFVKIQSFVILVVWGLFLIAKRIAEARRIEESDIATAFTA